MSETAQQTALFGAPARGAGPIELAARRTLEHLAQTEQLAGDAGALHQALILQLAAAVDRGFTAPKVSIATTTMARELRELLAELLPRPVEQPADELPEWLQAFRA